MMYKHPNPKSKSNPKSDSANAMRNVVSLARPFRLRFMLAAFLGCCSALAGAALMGTSAFLLSRAALHRPAAELGLAVVGVRFFALARVLSRYAERLAGHDASLRFLGNMRRSFFERLVPLVPSELDTVHSGKVLSRFVADIDELQNLYVRARMPVAIATLTSALTVAFVAVFSPIAAMILAVGLFIDGVIVPRVAFRYARRNAIEKKRLQDQLASRVIDLTDGFVELTAMGATQQVLNRAFDAATAVRELERRNARMAGFASAMHITCMLCITLLIALASIPTFFNGEIRPEVYVVLVFIAFSAFDALVPVANAHAKRQDIEASAMRVETLLDQVPSLREPSFPSVLPDNFKVRAASLKVQNASMRYPTRETFAFQNVDIAIGPGQKVAIVGSSGSGKTSLLHAMARVRPLTSGAVLVNNIEVDTLAKCDVQQLVGLVDEDAYVFHATLRDNMRLAKADVTDEELDEVAQRVCLDSWLNELPDRWSTMVGSYGTELSGGQLRRFVLARMLLRKPPILLVDEPTAGLDDETARFVMDDLLSASDGRSLVVATHRTAELDRFDSVIRLDEA